MLQQVGPAVKHQTPKRSVKHRPGLPKPSSRWALTAELCKEIVRNLQKKVLVVEGRDYLNLTKIFWSIYLTGVIV